LEELKNKLVFREKEYLKFIEEQKNKINVPKKNEMGENSKDKNNFRFKKIMKKTYWCPPSHRNLIDVNASYQINVKKTRKIRIDLKQ